MNNGFDAFDVRARTLTRGLIKAAEQDPTRTFEPGGRSFVRGGAVLLATAVAVAGVIIVGTGALHLQLSNGPVKHTPPPELSASPSPGATPTASPEPSPTLAPAMSITNLRMFTSTIGWSQRQSDGAILHTADGVAHWTISSPPVGAETIIAAAFVDAQDAHVLSAPTAALDAVGSATIDAWTTDNGGATWTRVGSFVGIAVQYEPDGSLDFVDRDHGWFSVTGLAAAGSSAMYVYRTVDGGATWTTVVHTAFMSPSVPMDSIPLGCDKNPASFINASTGWITAQCDSGSAFLYVTHDGGLRWQSQSLGVVASEFGYTTEPPQFVSQSAGFMVGFVESDSGPAASVFVTVNGGANWTRHAIPGTSSSGSEFINPDTGWALIPGTFNESAPAAANLWVTHDAGRTWTALDSNVNVGGLDLEFLTTEIGWAYTALPAPSPPAIGFFQTTDGGRTWTAINPKISG